jgi:hypothetical protein
MTKTPKNHNQAWTPADEKKLDKLIQQNTPTRLIAHELDRTAEAIYSHVSETDRSLKPTNQSPYNRRRKP